MSGRTLLLAASLLAFVGATAVADEALTLHPEDPWTGPTTIASLRFFGAATIPNDQQVLGALVGGLSGLDYSREYGSWVLVSDDRSEHAPARFYQATIELKKGTPKVTFFHMTTFGQPDGSLFPDAKTGGEVPDPESIRFDPVGGGLWWSSEGDRKRGLAPFVRRSQLNGVYLGALKLPSMFDIHPEPQTGPRNNNAFEGLGVTPKGDALWVAMESALYQDGPAATVDAGAVARFTKFDPGGKLVAQYAYPLDPIQAETAGAGSDNGVSEILALDDDRLLVLERSGVNEGGLLWTLHIRLYEAYAAGATDVSALESLVGADYRPLSKRLILNLDVLPELGSPGLAADRQYRRDELRPRSAQRPSQPGAGLRQQLQSAADHAIPRLRGPALRFGTLLSDTG